jgi:hypothetical protein
MLALVLRVRRSRRCHCVSLGWLLTSGFCLERVCRLRQLPSFRGLYTSFSNTSLVIRWRLEAVQDQIVACLTPLCIHSLREDQQKDATTHSKSKHKAEAARRRCELLLEAFRWAENAIWLAIPPTTIHRHAVPPLPLATRSGSSMFNRPNTV